MPIDTVRADVLGALEQGPVVVSSPTGSGKSTQIPRWCAAAGRVLVVEPRRVACRSLAMRVADLEGSKLGARVGYSVRDDHRASDATRVVFATPGIVLRMLSSDSISRMETVVLDEFHERSLDVDLILALLRKGWAGRLVVTSATLQGDHVAGVLGGVHIRAEGRTFPVEHHYRPGRNLLPEVRGLEDRVASAVRASERDPGDVLVFLPGKGEIASVARTLGGGPDEVLPLHGGLSLDAQSRVFRPTRGRRRVILATNVAETSLTIPGIGVVIDSGLVRQTRYFSGRGFLMLVPVAMDSADQRAGRAGRTASGVCYRLWDAAARLAPITAPEVYRESLVPLVLSAAACGESVADLPFLDGPKEHALDRATAELRALGALDEANTITERGRRLFGLPLPSSLGRLLVEAEGSPDHDAVIDLVAALSLDRPLFTHRPEEDEDDLRRAGCDCTALVRAVQNGDPSQHGLNPWALSEARKAGVRLRRALSPGPPSPALPAFARLAVAADPRCVHVKREHGRHTAWSNGGTEIELGTQSAVDPDAVDAIAVLDTRAIGLKGKTIVVATCATPISFREMTRLGLGRDRISAVEVAGGAAVAVIERVFARRVISRREEIPTGELAREAIRDLFLRGTIFKGTRETLVARVEAVTLWRRLVAAGLEEDLAVSVAALDDDTPEAFVLARLAALGVESGADLELLSAPDLLPDPLPEAALERLDRVWPRALSLGDAEYRIAYDLGRKIVTLHRIKGQRKDLPPVQYLPAFRGFAIHHEWRGKVRVLR